jgi:hypothetical protein
MVLIRNVALTVSCLVVIAGTASADDSAVVSRLTSHGGLSSSSAKKLVGKVNMRMAKSADATAASGDPMRAAVSLALFQSPNPPNSTAAAKVRLRLYAGLNEWALEAIFTPQPGVIAGCVREIGASQSECEALVAAAAESSVARIRSQSQGPAHAPPAAAPSYASRSAAPVAAPAAAAGGSRFGRFDSGFRAGSAPPQQYAAPKQQYAAPSRPTTSYQRAPAPQQVAAAPAYQRPAPAAYAAAAPAAPAVSEEELQSRKEAYKAQREAYLARQKAAFDERRAKAGAVVAADASEAPPRTGGAAAPAAPVASKSSASAPAAKASSKPAAAESGADEDEAPAEVAASSGGGKAGLDSDFLDGLLDDPLGGKGKK